MSLKRILIVDDSKSFRTLLRAYLTKDGYDVTEASDGSQGLSLFSLQPFDLVIMDIYMPMLDGIICIQKLKKDYPCSKIVAITGGMGSREMTDKLLDRARGCGADEIHSKGDDIIELLDKIRVLLTA